MRRFKFVGNCLGYHPSIEEKEIYDANYSFTETGRTVLQLAALYPDDWEEVGQSDVNQKFIQQAYIRIVSGMMNTGRCMPDEQLDSALNIAVKMEEKLRERFK
jgi:exosome complex RNA-binding protein Rrp42 (RNase PH superfamily)